MAFGEMGSGRTNLLLRRDEIRAGKQEVLGTTRTSNKNDMIGRVFHSVFSHLHFLF